jgi:small subunit ribosomal protein S4
MLESRLDNVVYRLGLAASRGQARQWVQHGHIDVNGHRLDAPSYLVKVGDVISVRPASRTRSTFKTLAQEREDRQASVPRWLSADPAQLAGQVVALPNREDIDIKLNEQLIVEYYSR